MRAEYVMMATLGIFIFTGVFLSLYFYTGTDEDALEAIAWHND